jgi:hypothetical protein
MNHSKSFRQRKVCLSQGMMKMNNLTLIGSKMSPKMVLTVVPKNPHNRLLNQMSMKKKSSMRTLKDNYINNKMRVSSAEKEPLTLYIWGKPAILKIYSTGDLKCSMEY